MYDVKVCCLGLALLQSQEKSLESYEESTEAPETRIREAAALHKFAEAAYTVLILKAYSGLMFYFY